MIEIIQSETFFKWKARLRDRHARAIIAARLFRLSMGMLGDTASVGDGIRELRIHFGPGYRLYYLQHGLAIVVLLCGGDKSSQTRDINTAKALAREWRITNG
ncbi:MAG: type II toxin-antitoxin system RelE/ParE family toxin [Pseudomonadota bacterium]